ncbi:MAG: prolipoprotein diacylglyceryl transferase [Pseudomonadota bacterium]|nr:prolipoprotein diacylglyceryl transferase [Pseudomonadota bacterium]
MHEYFVWDIDPVIYGIGFLKIRWYSLMFIISFVVGYHIVRKMFRDEGQNPETVSSLLTYAILGVIIGARLGHVLFYSPGFYFSNPLEILMVWKGGLASHGGGIGIITAVLLFCRRFKLNFLWLLDRIAPPTALLCGLVRIGNFFNSAIYGKPTDVAWAVVFKRTDPMLLPRHPTQLYESLSYLLVFAVLCILYWGTNSKEQRGRLWGILLVAVTAARFSIEFLKENQASFEQSMFLNMGQLLSVPFFFLGWVLIFRNKFKST